jgi:alkylation response protein AidB-like acyl-CoA dehydrogenase
MDFELSDDQLALRDAARDLLADHASPRRVRAVVDAGSTHDEKLWAAMVDQGWLGIERSEAAGGLGAGFVEAAVLLEELGRRVAPAPFSPTLLALAALRGTAWEDRLAGGAIGCVGWARPRDQRVLVPYAPVADVAVIATADRLVVHDLTSGDRPRREPAMDLTRCVGWLPVGVADRPGAATIGGPDEAAALLDRGATALAAESLGASAEMLDRTVEHAKTRVQFGKPIGSFQAVKHRCADMLVDVEGMRSTVYHAAWSLAAGVGSPDASVAASTAKAWTSEASRRVMASALQVHGGIGFTWEHDLHLYLKRAQLDEVSFGDAPSHRDRLAALLRPRIEAGEPIV